MVVDKAVLHRRFLEFNQTLASTFPHMSDIVDVLMLNTFYLSLMTPDDLERKGVVDGIDEVLTKDTEYYIDFIKPERSVNITNLANLALPRKPLLGIQITNMGNGVLYYNINTNQGHAGSIPLLSGQTSPPFRSKVPIFKDINLRCTGADTTVNIAIEY